MQPVKMAAVVDGHLCDTDGATLLAHDAYWYGYNFERPGRGTFLFRSADGQFFVQERSAWPLDGDRLEPLSAQAAMRLYDDLPVHEVELGAIFGPPRPSA